MDIPLEKIIRSYFKYYPKNNVLACYGFLFRIILKEQLILEKEQYLLLIKKINEGEANEEVFLRKEFQERYMGLNINDTHSSKPVGTINEKIVLRFAPNPNYIPTLGNVRGWILNKYLLDNSEKGSKLFLRLDDTDPKNKPATREGVEGYLKLIADYRPTTEIIRCSERLDFYYEKVLLHLIKGLLFIEDYTGSSFKLVLSEMIRGESDHLKIYCITSLRKEYCLRVIPADQQLIKNKNNYCLFPTLIYQTTIDDHFMKITHAARGKDLIVLDRRQKALSQYLGLTSPKFLHWGRIKVLSEKGIEKISSSLYKSNSENNIKKTEYTYQYLLDTGYKPKAIEKFILSYGFTENDICLDLKRLDYFNRF